MSNPRPSRSYARAVSTAAEERWARPPQASPHSQPDISTLAWSQPALEDKCRSQSQQTPQFLLHQPLANCSFSIDTHLHSRTQWLGRSSQESQAEMEKGQTHQLFEEGSFLVLLRITLILVQTILQFQCECVIVGSHYLQHLGRSKARQGLGHANPSSVGPPCPFCFPYWVEFSLEQHTHTRLYSLLITPKKSGHMEQFPDFWDHFLIFS